MNLCNNKKWTPLMKACRRFNVENGCYNILIAAGSHLNSINEDGQTASHIAVTEGGFSCLYALIQAGADVNIVNAEGNTVLSCVVTSHRSLIPEILLKGAKVNVTSPNTLQGLIIAQKQLANKYDCMLLYAAGERAKGRFVCRGASSPPNADSSS